MDDSTKENAQASNLMQKFYSSLVGLAMTVGIDVGLMDAMLEMDGTWTSSDLAKRCKCKERYVREWLGLMACEKAVRIDDSSGFYYVQKEDKPALRETLTSIRILTVFARKYNKLRDCFKEDGPNGVSSEEDLGHALWFDSVRRTEAGTIIDNDVLSNVPELVRLLDTGGSIADFGCGTGRFVIHLAKRFPLASVTGLDLDQFSIDFGINLAADEQVKNATFVQGDMTNIPDEMSEKFDAIISVLTVHDLPFPRQGLLGVKKALKAGGVLLLLEGNVSSSQAENAKGDMGGFIYATSILDCLPNSLIVPGSEGAGMAFGKDRFLIILKDVGFRDIVQFTHTIDSTVVQFVCYK